MKTGIANLPLHYGKAPSWLFSRMKSLAREIVLYMVTEHGPEEVLRRLSDPFWFQAFGCLLGFDWHSSGLTTTVCGALKEAVRDIDKEIVLFVAGGKGSTSRKTPQEVTRIGDLISLDPEPLVYASRMSAKVDSAGLQDGFQLYHHTFIFTASGDWAVIQQGMNESTRYARRYHWLKDTLKSFINEPHLGIVSDSRWDVLNMVAEESEPCRQASSELAREKPEKLTLQLNRIQSLELPAHHEVLAQDIHPERLEKIFLKTYEGQPQNFEQLLGMPGVGPKTIRALSLISELVYGAGPSFRDPARYSFAHGGKDGHPYPVDRENYDRSIEILRKAVNKARIGRREKVEAIRRLSSPVARLEKFE